MFFKSTIPENMTTKLTCGQRWFCQLFFFYTCAQILQHSPLCWQILMLASCLTIEQDISSSLDFFWIYVSLLCSSPGGRYLALCRCADSIYKAFDLSSIPFLLFSFRSPFASQWFGPLPLVSVCTAISKCVMVADLRKAF